MINNTIIRILLTLFSIFMAGITVTAQVAIPVGAGSYASYVPLSQQQTDEYYGMGAQQIIDMADPAYLNTYNHLHLDPALVGRPLPSNKWWTDVLIGDRSYFNATNNPQRIMQQDAFGGNLWAYPAMLDPVASGFNLFFPNNWSGGGFNTGTALAVGGSTNSGAGTFTALQSMVTDWSDWGFQFKLFDANSNYMQITLVRGVPFVWTTNVGVWPRITLSTGYTLYDTNNTAISVPGVGSTFTASMFSFDYNGRSFGVFAPDNTTFKVVSSTVIEAQLSGANKYLVFGLLPSHASLYEFSQYAYAQVTGTRMDYVYDQVNGMVDTTWKLTTTPLKNGQTNTLQGWLPHHYRTTQNDLVFKPYTYLTPRGLMKVAAGNQFHVNFIFHGIAPVLPAPKPAGLTNDFSTNRMQTYIQNFTSDNHTGLGDTYGGGKDLGIKAQYITFADQMGMASTKATLINTLETSLGNWYTYTLGENNNFFAKYTNWPALIGSSASYGSQAYNDQHFHYGYFAIATGLLGLYDPAWLSQYSGMATLVAKQYANWDRSDTNFPYFRTFDIWEGHSWAGGTSGGGGENQESSSEAMNSWVGLFMLGNALGDTNIIAAGAMGYATESRAVNEYWQDMYRTNFPPSYGKCMNGILGAGSLAFATYFDGDPAWVYAIQMVPQNHWNNYLVNEKSHGFYQWTNLWNDRVLNLNTYPLWNVNSNYANGYWLQYSNCVWSGNTNVNPAIYTNNIPAGSPAPGQPNAPWALQRNMTTNTANVLGGYTGNYILGWEALFNPDDVAALMNDPNAAVCTDRAHSGPSYYLAHATRRLGDQDPNSYTSIPTSQVYYNSSNGVRTVIIFNPAPTNQTAVLYSQGSQIASIVAAPGATTVASGVAGAPWLSGTPVSTSEIDLTWSPVPGATGYNVKRSSVSGGPYTIIAAGVVATNYSDTGLATDTTYYYVVSAINGTEGPDSSEESITTIAIPPVAPTGVTPTAGDTQVSLAWNVPATATSYNVKRSTINGGPYTIVGSPSVASYVDTGLVNGTTYYYVVSAINSGGESADSGQVSARPILAAPIGFTLIPDNGQIPMFWNARPGATGYKVGRSNISGGPYTVIANLAVTNYTDTAVVNGTTYYYVVSATNAACESANSSQKSVTPGPFAGYEPFDYTAGSLTNGTPCSATGFLGNWYCSANATIVSPGLAYSNLPAANNCLQSSSGYQYENLAVPQSSGTIWISFLMNQTGDAGGNRFGFEMLNSSGNGFLFAYHQNSGSQGYPCIDPVTNYITVGTELTPRSTTLRTYANTNFYMIKLVYTAGAVTELDVYSNPAAGKTNVPAADFTITSGLGLLGTFSVIGLKDGQSVTIDEVRIGTTFGYAAGYVPPPVAPTGLSAMAVSTNQINLSWNPVNGASGYNIKRSTSSGAEVTIASVALTNYNDPGLIKNTTYYYVVTATNLTGESTNSAEASATPIDKTPATVTLGNLSQTYDGTGKAASVSTTPGGLTVNLAYNGSAALPTNAGSYTVVGTIYDATYQGIVTNTLTINKAAGTVTLGNLSQNYNGTGKAVSGSTTPSGLTVNLTYNGSATLPTNIGSYTVVGSINDPNYQGSATNTLNINMGVGTVTLGNLSQVYDGTGKAASASTTPSGLTVNLTYNGSATLPTNAGSYTVVGTINNPNYQGSATNTMIIKGIGTVTLGSLSQMYDGTGKAASASTTPTNLTVNFTYNGSATLPINAGSYTVVGTINDTYNAGSATNTMTIVPAAPTGLTAIPGSTFVQLSWLAAGGATNYNVKRSLTDGGPYSTIVGTSSLSYTNTGLTNNVTYFYVVSGVGGGFEGANSAQVSVMPVFTAPTGLNATVVSSNQVKLSWNSVNLASSYYVKRSTSSGMEVTVTNVISNSFYDTGLSANTTYYYMVSATNAAGESPNSSEVSATPAPFAAYEPFNYNAGNLANTAPATGTAFIGNWYCSASPTIVSPGLAYSGLPVANNCLQFSSSGYQYENLAVGLSNATVWISFLMKQTNDLGGNRYGFEMLNSSGNGFLFAYHQNSGSQGRPCIDNITNYTTVGPELGSSATLQTYANTNYYVIKLVYTAGAVSELDVYSNPTAGQTNVPAPDFTITSGLDLLGTFSRIGLKDATSVTIDEVRIGRSFAYVAGFAGVDAPTGLSATADSSGQINLSWNAVTGASTYNVKRATNSGGPYTFLANVTATGYTDTGLANSGTYYYVVSALNWFDESSSSTEASATLTLTYHAPVLAAISNQTILAGRTLVISNSASDVDSPPQTLAFSLFSAPTNAAIDAGSGVFTWRPTIAQSLSTQTVAVVVSDNGIPAMSATQYFNATVLRPVIPVMNTASVTQGRFGFWINGDVGPDYTILTSTNLTSWNPLVTSNSPSTPFFWADPKPSTNTSLFYRVLLGP